MIGHNVPVHTSLPPQVEGHLRCFLCLSVSQIKWIVPQHPGKTVVHVTWWGETGAGTIFRLVISKLDEFLNILNILNVIFQFYNLY